MYTIAEGINFSVTLSTSLWMMHDTVESGNAENSRAIIIIGIVMQIAIAGIIVMNQPVSLELSLSLYLVHGV